MKRVLCLTLIILMVLPLLFSCGERKEDQDAPSATDPTEAVGEDIPYFSDKLARLSDNLLRRRVRLRRRSVNGGFCR